MLLAGVTIVLFLLHFCDCITFLSREDSFAEYPPWSARLSGSLEFEFKTFNPRSLLIYAEEISDSPNDRKSFLKLSLLHGSLNLVVQMGGEDSRSKKTKRFSANLNDLRWHKVRIVRDKNKTTVTIDGRWSFDLTNQGTISELPVNSSLFVGGVNKEKLKDLVSGRIKLNQIPRFVGCIRNLRYSTKGGYKDSEALISHSGLASGCVDACAKSNHTPCRNGGKCMNRFFTFKCNCIGTGFKGRNCTIPLESAYFRGVDYITWSPSRHHSVYQHVIVMRFKTYLENGILLTTGKGGDSLILELYRGNLRMSIDLGGGSREIPIDTGDKGLNDMEWHKVEIIRKGTFCVLKLDDRITKNGTTPGRHSKFDFPRYNKIFFAGHTKPRTLEISKAKQNFSGCLQDVWYNEIQVLFRKFYTRSTQIESVGSVQKGCPLITPPPTTAATTKAWTTRKLSRHTTESNVGKSTVGLSPSVIRNDNFESQNRASMSKEPLSKSQIAWITSGIIVGALVLVFTTACLVHRCKRRYDGFLISSALKNKDNQQRASQRYKAERVVFLEHGTKEKLDRVTKF